MWRGRSRPKFARIWSTVSWETTGFSRISARKSPGESWMMRTERVGAHRVPDRRLRLGIAEVLDRHLLGHDLLPSLVEDLALVLADLPLGLAEEAVYLGLPLRGGLLLLRPPHV